MPDMQILIVTPAPRGSLKGNRITAERWGGILVGLGHRVALAGSYSNQRCDVLVALHARRSASSIRKFAEKHPDKPIVLAMTGTDLYEDLPDSVEARQSVERATRIVVLQTDAVRYLSAAARKKTTVIYQSCRVPNSFRAAPRRDGFEVIVMGHLRDVKDPLRTAAAARQLPATSRIVVTHLGAPLDKSLARQARREMKLNPRYQWLGEVPREEALRILGRSRLLVVSSRVEGAPNVASEAIALGVPVLATKISGMIGMFGRDYPGYFAVGDTDGLARLLAQAETDVAFYRQLSLVGKRLKKLVAPAREANAWRHLLAEIAK